MKIVTVIQARMSSTRLPGKIMLPILGKPMLQRMIERIKNAKLIGKIVVATSINADDDEVEEFCKKNNIVCFRGHLTDLLDRHYQVGKKFSADAVVKIPSDCPLIDPQIIDKVIQHYIQNDELDFVSNLHPATYPDGNDVEIMSFDSLGCAWKDASKNYEREHTTPFIWENNDTFKVGNVVWENGLDYSTTHRWTIDFPEDYEFIRKVYEELYAKNPNFSLNDILTLLKQKPEIAEINSRYLGKYWYENYLDELTNIDEYKNKLSNDKQKTD
ncbi:MAG: Polysaccharide biosynthesis protein [Ignavibacteria bacterium]|nr:MAG: Polysaccharide biosynthesis protein [Ignavibacteria bacterium]KAF0161638.1 MAG: Polysaccharide biosynthesis protein [Ignavibacteria bacterium]